MTEVLVICNIVNTYIVFSFMNMMYERRYTHRLLYAVAFIVYCSLHVAVNVQRIYIVNVLFTIFIIHILGRFLYRDMHLKAVYNLLFALYLIFMDAAAFAVMSLILSQPVLYIMFSEYGVIIGVFIQYTIVLSTYKPLLRRFFQTRQDEIQQKWQNIFFIVLTVFQIWILYYLWNKQSEVSTIFLLLNSAGFISVDMYLVYLFAIVRRHEQKRYEMGLHKQQSLLLHQHIREMQATTKETRRMIHDIRGHQTVIESLFEKKEIKSAMLLRSQLNEAMAKIEAPLHCWNPIMDTMINNCRDMAKSMGIEMKIIVQQDIDWQFMKELHMTALFSNVFNNALEACQEMEPGAARFIECRIRQRGLFVIVNVRNSYAKDAVRLKDGKYLSTKAEHLGIGLCNIGRIVKLYQGDLNIKADGTAFTVAIFLTMCPVRQEDEEEFYDSDII